MKKKMFFGYFTKGELLLWISSAALIIISFAIFDRKGYLALCASLIGATSLIYSAKGNPIGQVLMIVFSALYGIISFSFGYYGEMITYLGMTVPMAVLALISWIRNPFAGDRSEVRVNKIGRKEIPIMIALSLIVTAGFYFVLAALNTANIIPSTVSVATSFIAAYLTYRRSAYYALAYAVNDIVLILLWVLATMRDISYLSVIICFVTFLVNDVCGFVNWKRMHIRQQE